MGRSTQVAELLETLAGDDPEVVRRALDEFSAKDQAAALASREAGNGGSQTSEGIYFEFAHDTSGLLAGVVVATLNVGDVLAAGGLTPTVAWNGTTPRGHLCWDPADVATTEFHAKNLAMIGNQSGTTNAFEVVGGANNEFGWMALNGPQPLYLVVDDGAAGPAGGTTGEGIVVLHIYRAP